MRFFKSSKPEEAKEEATEIPPRPVAPDPRSINTMPDSRTAPPPPRPEPAPIIPVRPLDGGSQDTVPPLSASVAPKPAPPVEEVRPIPPATPRTIPDADALRSLVEQAVRDSEGSKLEAVRLGGGATSPSLMVGGSLNFPSLYEKVGVPDPPFSAEQMLEMLARLPADMQLDMKRDTVTVTLEMMGKKINTTEDSIVGDTSRKMTTLATFTQEYDKKTKDRVAQGEAEIADLLAQVEAKRQAVAEANQRYATIQKICESETDRLSEILNFFKAAAPAMVTQVFSKEMKGSGGKKPVPATTTPVVEAKPAPAKPIPAEMPPATAETTGPKPLTPITLPPAASIGEGDVSKPASSAAETPTVQL